MAKLGKSQMKESELGIHQIPYRIHKNDRTLMRQLFRNDHINFQVFIDACVQAYLKGDPVMIRFIADWKELNVIPEEDKKVYTLSLRERQKLLDELEQINPKKPVR